MIEQLWGAATSAFQVEGAYDYLDGLILKIYELKDQTTFTIPEIYGSYVAKIEVRRKFVGLLLKVMLI